jgi:hypothetical protein
MSRNGILDPQMTTKLLVAEVGRQAATGLEHWENINLSDLMMQWAESQQRQTLSAWQRVACKSFEMICDTLQIAKCPIVSQPMEVPAHNNHHTRAAIHETVCTYDIYVCRRKLEILRKISSKVWRISQYSWFKASWKEFGDYPMTRKWIFQMLLKNQKPSATMKKQKTPPQRKREKPDQNTELMCSLDNSIDHMHVQRPSTALTT